MKKFVLFVLFFKDIDECSNGSSNCSDICKNNLGSFTCSCHTGYKLNDDLRTCQGNFSKIYISKNNKNLEKPCQRL